MQTFRNFIIRRTALFGSIPFALGFCAVVVASISIFMRSEIEGQMILAETLRAETAVNIDATQRILETTSRYIEKAGLYPHKDLDGLLALLSTVREKNPSVSAIWVSDITTGKILCALPSAPMPDTFRQENNPYITMRAESKSSRVIWSDIQENRLYNGMDIAASIYINGYLITAWCNPASLVGIISHKKWNRRQFAFVTDSKGQLISHPDHMLIQKRTRIIDIPAVRKASEGTAANSFFRLEGIDEREYLYTVVPEPGTGWLIGVARERNDMFRFVSWLINGAILSLIAGISVIAFGAVLSARRIEHELEIFIDTTEAIASGSYGNAPVQSHFSEFRALCESVKSLAAGVQDREKRLHDLNLELETRVQDRTEELRISNQELITAMSELSAAQDKMIQSEKLSALGQLAAGIAHELNTPLGATISAVSVLENLFSHDLMHVQKALLEADADFRVTLFSLYEQCIEKIHSTHMIVDRAERKKNQTLLREMDVKSAFRISDYLINTGLASLPETDPGFFSRNNHEEILKVLNTLVVPFRMTHLISEAAQKSVLVVQALQNYLRNDAEDAFVSIQIEDGIDSVLMLLNNKLRHGIQVIRDYAGLLVYAVSHQLSQVWMNILNNSIYAMENRGTIRISTRKDGDRAIIIFCDDGPGIPAHVTDKIFEPFFTTKQGEGMGLGLDICKRIIVKHRGKIEMKSVPGKTEFIISFPLAAASREQEGDSNE